MYRTLAGLALGVLCVGLLSACDEQTEPTAISAPQTPHETLPSDEPATQAADVAPLNVTFAVHAALQSDRRLLVEGQTNLPDESGLQVTVEREVSRVRWQARTRVENGQFSAGPFGSGSGLPDGGYVVRVDLAPASVQQASVQARIGDKGQHLAGDLVTQARHGLGQVTTYSRRFLVGSETRRTRDQVEVVEDD